MTILDKAIKAFGFESPITITIASLEEQGKKELAEQLFEACAQVDCDDDFEDEVDDCGFDAYMGCYTYDC